MVDFRIKRIYEPAAAADGTRILVDRVWPRGVSKEEAAVDVWLKEVAPSTELRKWFGHEPERFGAFRERYLEELKENPAVDELKALAADHEVVTLLYGAKDEVHNQAVILQELLQRA